ncbi:MAG: TldD/PmbA family protein [Lachnospiraceae bacterium]|nr:TldD/PmbA family protein [Lachnospiraceae bacterium]
MKAPFSPHLLLIRDGLKELIALLGKDYEYVSVLATDSKGISVSSSKHKKSVDNRTMSTERGIVARVWKDGGYAEYAFNEFYPDMVADIAKKAKRELDAQLSLLQAIGVKNYETPVMPDEPQTLFVEKEAEILPEDVNVKALVEKLNGICETGLAADEHVINCTVRAASTHVNKMFLTKNRDLCQSYVYSEGSVFVVAGKDGETKINYESVSGLAGAEIFDALTEKVKSCVSVAVEMLDADRIVPGEYEVITSPEVSGLIAHEAFGHGVEMDMFVKDRALGKEYIGKRVGSDLVTMHEGAAYVDEVSSYVFDDEGTLGGDVIEIDHGILKTGICDVLAALRLGTLPTGNGKRESYDRKAYTRMTNTVFESGDSTLEEMIASVKFGYLLEGMDSGMEDPKHWGIQCIVSRGREIKDGKLTGKMVAPIIMTGYVPDLLGNISMLSKDCKVFGSGGCGKGHKEWVKVSDGGPYIKTKARLG